MSRSTNRASDASTHALNSLCAWQRSQDWGECATRWPLRNSCLYCAFIFACLSVSSVWIRAYNRNLLLAWGVGDVFDCLDSSRVDNNRGTKVNCSVRQKKTRMSRLSVRLWERGRVTIISLPVIEHKKFISHFALAHLSWSARFPQTFWSLNRWSRRTHPRGGVTFIQCNTTMHRSCGGFTRTFTHNLDARNENRTHDLRITTAPRRLACKTPAAGTKPAASWLWVWRSTPRPPPPFHKKKNCLPRQISLILQNACCLTPVSCVKKWHRSQHTLPCPRKRDLRFRETSTHTEGVVPPGSVGATRCRPLHTHSSSQDQHRNFLTRMEHAPLTRAVYATVTYWLVRLEQQRGGTTNVQENRGVWTKVRKIQFFCHSILARWHHWAIGWLLFPLILALCLQIWNHISRNHQMERAFGHVRVRSQKRNESKGNELDLGKFELWHFAHFVNSFVIPDKLERTFVALEEMASSKFPFDKNAILCRHEKDR